MPFVDGLYTNTRMRPGFEIDERARFENLSGRAGVSIRVQSKTKLLLWAREEQFRYDDGDEFQSASLSRALDRDSSYLRRRSAGRVDAAHDVAGGRRNGERPVPAVAGA